MTIASRPPAPQAGWTIATVERETGISKDTLRVWERRYGFPKPERDAIGDRRYAAEQVQRLQLLKRLIDGGHRPGQVVPSSDERLAELAAARSAPGRGGPVHAPTANEARGPLDMLLALVAAHDSAGLRSMLRRALAEHGVSRFVTELAAPATAAVGEAWARGELQIFEEHLCSECLAGVLREAVVELQRLVPRSGPAVLLAIAPGELHTLGLQMVEALLTLEGAACASLGAHAPLQQIAGATRAHGADVLCLSFSAAANANQVSAALATLRSELPPTVAIWAGGAGAALARRVPRGVRVFDSLSGLPAALREHRAEAAATQS